MEQMVTHCPQEGTNSADMDFKHLVSQLRENTFELL